MRGISVKAAKLVKVDEDSFRANNLIWGTNIEMKFVMVTFNDNFNSNMNDFINERYEIINLQKDSDKLFINQLTEKLYLLNL